MERLLNDEIQGQVRELFQQLQKPVQVLFFGATVDCETCESTQQLLEEVTALSDKLTLQVYDLDNDAAVAVQYKVDKAPGIVIAANDGGVITDYGIRFYGIPAGMEFSTLIHDLMLVSSRESGLSESTRQFLQGLEQPVHLMVFVTPT